MTTLELAAKLKVSRQRVLQRASERGLKPLNRGKRGQPAVWPKGTLGRLRARHKAQ